MVITQTIEMVGKFVGPYRIENVGGSDKKTFLGDEYIVVELDNGNTELLPKKVVEIVITDEKSDLTTQQDKLFGVIIPQILGIMADYDLNMLDVQTLMSKIDMSLRENYKLGVAKKFGVSDEQKITMMMLNDILTDKK